MYCISVTNPCVFSQLERIPTFVPEMLFKTFKMLAILLTNGISIALLIAVVVLLASNLWLLKKVYFEKKNPETVKPHDEKDFSKSKTAVILQIAATGSIGFVGIVFTIFHTMSQDKSDKMKMATDMRSNREKSETDFRQNMFLPIVSQVLNDSLPLEKRFKVLQLFQNNFNDLFNTRSLYDELWQKAYDSLVFNRIHKTDTVHVIKVMDDMILLARYISDKQEEEMNESTALGDTLTDKNSISFPFYENDDDKVDSTGGPWENIVITLDTVEERLKKSAMNIRMDVNVYDSPKHLTHSINKIFHLSYFNTPLTDNFVMPNGSRVAIILKELYSPDSALIDIIHFPADYSPVGNRPSIKSLKSLLDK